MVERQFVIIGAGVAGLAAACQLVDRGFKPILIEGGAFPSHKICGEFFSPEVVPLLKQWGVAFEQKIDHALISSSSISLKFPFVGTAATMSHLHFDAKLLDYALNKGAKFFPKEKVLNVTGTKGGFEVMTETLGPLPASHLLIASGRLPFFYQPSKPLYQGAKAYFTGLEPGAPLRVFSFKGCYLGIVESQRSF